MSFYFNAFSFFSLMFFHVLMPSAITLNCLVLYKYICCAAKKTKNRPCMFGRISAWIYISFIICICWPFYSKVQLSSATGVKVLSKTFYNSFFESCHERESPLATYSCRFRLGVLFRPSTSLIAKLYWFFPANICPISMVSSNLWWGLFPRWDWAGAATEPH